MSCSQFNCVWSFYYGDWKVLRTHPLHFSADYAFFHSTTATEKCLWTHPFENRKFKLSPFVSRGSNLHRAPQGKIECNDCVTRVSWPSPLGQNRFIALFSRLCIFSFYYGDWKVFVNATDTCILHLVAWWFVWYILNSTWLEYFGYFLKYFFFSCAFPRVVWINNKCHTTQRTGLILRCLHIQPLFSNTWHLLNMSMTLYVVFLQIKYWLCL